MSGLDYKNRVHIDDKNAHIHLHSAIHTNILELNYKPYMKLIILCIGTDRSTGDALGPLTGTFLQKNNFFMADVIGDISTPVHAGNLNNKIDSIQKKYFKPFIIAIDAGLGKKSSVGYIDVKKGPLKPGTGVNKNLTEIGDLHITGLVNVGGYMEYLVLQSTRLNIVLKMAKVIARAMKKVIKELQQDISLIDQESF